MGGANNWVEVRAMIPESEAEERNPVFTDYFFDLRTVESFSRSRSGGDTVVFLRDGGFVLVGENYTDFKDMFINWLNRLDYG